MACARFYGSMNTVTELIALLMVLLALQSPMALAARFSPWGPSEHTSPRGSLDEGFSVNLLHSHHVDLPYARPNITMAERIKVAVKSSQARVQFFHQAIDNSKSVVFGSNKILVSPAYAREVSHVMEFSLGTRPQKFLGALDTASDLTWVFDLDCKIDMPRAKSLPEGRFSRDQSSSYRTVPYHNDPHCSALPEHIRKCSSQQTCQFAEKYVDESTVFGDLALETLTLTSKHGVTHGFPNFPFGSATDYAGGTMYYPAMVGLGQGSLSLVSLIGPHIKNVFAYCFVDFEGASTKSSYVVFGTAGKIPLTYTTLVINHKLPSFYYLGILGIVIAGIPLSYPPSAFSINPETGDGGMILDSGTTFTYLFHQVYQPFLRRLDSLIHYHRVIDNDNKYGLDLCYSPIINVTHLDFPEVIFQFADRLNVLVGPKNLFIKIPPHNYYCLALRGTDSYVSIFGSFQQQNHIVAYDRGENRVGFAPHTC